MNYLEHGRTFPSRRANADPDPNLSMGFDLAREGTSTSRHLAERHPQVLIIAQVDGGLLCSRVERLFVGSRDCTKLLEGVHKQVAVVRDLLEPDTPVHGVLCFVEADWPLLGGSFVTHDVHVLSPKGLCLMLKNDGPLTLETITQVHSTLGRTLQPA